MLMEQGIKENVFPGGVLLVSKDENIIFFESYGYANIFSKQIMTRETIFDLASVTKTLATTLAVIILIQKSKLRLDQSVASVLPELKGTDKENIQIKHLLGHDSGFPAHQPYYILLRDIPPEDRKRTLRNFLVKEPLVYPTGTQVIYSDLGFMLLEWIIERVSGERLDYFVNKEIYTRLGLKNLFFVEIQESESRSQESGVRSHKLFAATELCPWRNFLVQGVVHDDNAYTAGGIEGHAGLFGTAMDVWRLASELLADFHGYNLNPLFKKEILQIFFKPRKITGRGLGFDSPSLSDASCGKYFSKNSVGHLGFTGTSYWIDPERNLIVILLTNRVHPTRDNIKIKAFRPIIHDAVIKGLAP